MKNGSWITLSTEIFSTALFEGIVTYNLEVRQKLVLDQWITLALVVAACSAKGDEIKYDTQQNGHTGYTS